MKKHIYLMTMIYLIMVCFANIVYSQTHEIDSLKNELSRLKYDTSRVNLLNKIAFSYYAVNPDEGMNFVKKALELAKQLNYDKGICESFRVKGVINLVQGIYEQSLKDLFKSLELAQKMKLNNQISGALSNIAVVYLYQTNYSESLEYFLKALKINEELGDKNGISQVLGNIGIVYKEQLKYKEALEYYFKAQKLYEELGNKEDIAINLSNIGVIYDELSDYKKALEYYFNALEINKELGDKYNTSKNLGNIGIIFKNKKDFAKAMKYFLESLNLAKELDDKNSIERISGNIGNLLLKEGKFYQAIDYLIFSAKISEEINDKFNLIACYRNLSEAYYKLGKYKKAIDYKEKFIIVKDSVYNIENNKKIATLEIRRETELKQKEIELLKSEQARQDAELKSRKFQLFGTLFIIFASIIVIIITIRERKKSEKLLLNILPKKIANRLKKKEKPLADHFEEASVVFIDIVGFTKSSAGIEPKRIVEVLNILYSKLDYIAQKNCLEKIKTIGDCYMAAAGIPVADPDNANKAAQFALDAMNMLKDYDTGDGTILNFRCGIDCGPVVAGVIGENKFIYDVWGDMVNTASRMESNGVVGKIQVTERFKEKLFIKNEELGIKFVERGEIEIKGKGLMRTWFLTPKN